MKISSRIKDLLNSYVKRSNWYNELFQDCNKFWKHNTFNLKVINLGSTSSVHAFSYDDLPIAGANFALSRNPLYGDLVILKNYISFLDVKGSYVIIPLCPFSSLAGSYEYMDDRYYTILYASTINNYSYIHEREVVNKKEYPIYYIPFMDLINEIRLLFNKKHKRIVSDDFFKKDAEEKMQSWFREFSIHKLSNKLSLKNQDAINDAAAILDEIVSYCKKKNATPIITVPPVHNSLYSLIEKTGEDILINQLLSKLSNHNYIFRNYIAHPDYLHASNLFENSFLLNKTGAKKFTKQLLEELDII